MYWNLKGKYRSCPLLLKECITPTVKQFFNHPYERDLKPAKRCLCLPLM